VGKPPTAVLQTVLIEWVDVGESGYEGWKELSQDHVGELKRNHTPQLKMRPLALARGLGLAPLQPASRCPAPQLVPLRATHGAGALIPAATVEPQPSPAPLQQPRPGSLHRRCHSYKSKQERGATHIRDPRTQPHPFC
jgi:hypothetical protein